MRRVLVGSVVAGAAGLAVLTPLRAAPTEFRVVFEGVHRPATFSTETGLQHEGPFSASMPACVSGYAVDVSQTGQSARRRFACAHDGGSFDAIITPLPAEHGGSGNWRIVAGTGPLTRLRGRGTWTSVLVSGDPAEPHTVGYRSAWQGVADLDDTAPAITVRRARVERLRRPARTFALRLSIEARDDVAGSAVSFVVTAQVGFGTFVRSGRTSTGTASVSFRIRAPRGVQTVRLRLRAADPVGNERAAVRSIRLPSPRR